jgi:thiamine pyrophosphokinase
VGVAPHIVIGDMDSIVTIPEGAEMVCLDDQNTTDCDKLLAYVADQGWESATLVGVEGTLLDHTLAVLHSAAKARIRVRIGLRQGIGWILRHGDEVTIPTVPGRRISLIPLTPSEEATLQGVEWPLMRQRLDPLGVTSVSNRATEDSVFVHVWKGAAFCFAEYPDEEMPFW